MLVARMLDPVNQGLDLWLLSQGPSVEVLGPPDQRARIGKKLRRLPLFINRERARRNLSLCPRKLDAAIWSCP